MAVSVLDMLASKKVARPASLQARHEPARRWERDPGLADRPARWSFSRSEPLLRPGGKWLTPWRASPYRGAVASGRGGHPVQGSPERPADDWPGVSTD